MKLFAPKRYQAAALLTIGFLVAGPAEAQRLELQPESTLSLSGDSTLHPFISTATVLILSAEANAPQGLDVMKAILEQQALRTWTLVIPAKGLKSKESGLDKNMYKALKAEAFPEIVFQMNSYEVSARTVSSAIFLVKASGTLSIAGREQPVHLEMESHLTSEGMQVKGQYTLLMTDYGIKPPTMMMGAIKVRNPVVIQFDLRLR